MKLCPKCGSEALDNEKKCKTCGNTDFHSAAAPLPTAGPISGNRVAVPFVPVIKVGTNEASQCAQQLTSLIQHYERQGWRFDHLEDVTTLRNNGCLAGLFGPAQTVLTFQVAIFEKAT